VQGGGYMNIFPIIQPQTIDTVTDLKLYKEVKWDYEKNTPVFINGYPIIVSGKDAVLVWAWKALQTPRYRYEIYTWDHGCEIESLIGQPYTDELKQSEAARYVKECLLTNPYITGVSDITVIFEQDQLSIRCTLETIYGEARLNV
jgi:hypothetical protein